MTSNLPATLAAATSAYLPADALRLLGDAYELAVDCHRDQLRLSGDPYITHPVAVATILATQRATTELVCAGILHDVNWPAELLCERFGPAVADLVGGFRELEKTHDAEAASDDVLRLKLADRLHNMRTISYVSPAKQTSKSAQTLQILVPVAARLHLTDIGLELSALSSAVLHAPTPGCRRPQSHTTLGIAALLLPQTMRSRWLTEWAGELAMLPTARRRAGFVAGVILAMPAIAWALRKQLPRQRRRGSSTSAVLSGGAVAAAALNTGLNWPTVVVVVAALAVMAAVLFAETDVAARRLQALIKTWRNPRHRR
ncbi:HD domain-containing protein [Amycolatopsis sp. NPDC098790]|uniref:HD domain-containing protein n=1 Tax=Amycolatopsis sp. NPDC098790 TaxID=3363939 RepID=UPI00380095A9